ncbi:MAG: DUF4190 domain-containing protein [Actinoplanes sp.]
MYQNPAEPDHRLLASFPGLAVDIHPRPVAVVTSRWAVAALVAVLFAAPVGAVLGHLALRKIRQGGSGGRAMARGAVVIGWSNTVALVVLWLVHGWAA